MKKYWELDEFKGEIMYTIRKIYKVEYAHQLKSAYSACCHETIHGHSGVIEVFFSSEIPDKNGMVIDFGEVSTLIKKYIMDNFDHVLILPDSFNKKYLEYLKRYNKKLIITGFNPTAENFCQWLYWDIFNLIKPLGIKRKFFFDKVRFHETETGYAEYSPDQV